MTGKSLRKFLVFVSVAKKVLQNQTELIYYEAISIKYY